MNTDWERQVMLPVGVQISSLKLPLKHALPCVAALGVSGVEIDARGEIRPREISQSGLRQVRKWLDDYRLKVCSVRFQTRRGYDVEDELQLRIEATKEAMSFARSLGCHLVINQVGRIVPADRDAAWNRLVQALTDLGHYGQHVGAWLAMETGSESGPDMAQLIESVPPGSVMVNLDPGNLIVNGFSPLEAVSALGAHIGQLHAHDGVRDLARGRGLEVPLGRGTADIPALLAALEDLGFRGYVTVGSVSSKNPLDEIALAVQYLKNL
jgi:sugar phosphate isomerase/epimerase